MGRRSAMRNATSESCRISLSVSCDTAKRAYSATAVERAGEKRVEAVTKTYRGLAPLRKCGDFLAAQAAARASARLRSREAGPSFSLQAALAARASRC